MCLVVSDILFEIEKINCSYKTSKRAVLEIEELIINKNEVVFIIGPSGVGKSTILETLGLMNNTIDSTSSSKFNFYPKNLSIDMRNIWEKKERELSEMRRLFFSFIFQSDNLFSSLTGYQNIIASSLIEGKESNLAKQQAYIVLNDILEDLNSKDQEDFSITEMSGGQKQRVSFARAIISNYQVLFADEPTGNLDWYNAELLMAYLIKSLEKTDGSSAVIVSHDIKLALDFADKIIYIDKYSEGEKKEKVYYGVISKDSVFIKSKENGEWNSNSSTQSYSREKLEKEIKMKFKGDSEKEKIKEVLYEAN
jgi:ABC-type lipoprotein export system ATPase subunit